MKLAKFLATLVLFGATYYAVYWFLVQHLNVAEPPLTWQNFAVIFGAPFVVALLLWAVAFYLMRFLFASPAEQALADGTSVSWRVQELAGEVEELRRRLAALEGAPSPPAEGAAHVHLEPRPDEIAADLPRIS
ncbi:hypothetical protein HS125_15630 [bacterium]|nr:hypothetical protein [bacterium]